MIPKADQTALGTYQFPLKGRIKVTQGIHGGISHLGLVNGYAWDFVIVNEEGEFCTAWDKKEDHFIYGAPVHAAADGVVTFVHDSDPDTEPGQNDPAYDGNFINIRHPNGETSIYAHIKEGSSLVKAGDPVRQGRQIAVVGCSGRYADFPHLHFQVNRENHSVEARLTGLKRFLDGSWVDQESHLPQQDEILQTSW
jgi:murein DD-endopeptidase MepM/ murein hydrolase activator NlpD